MSRPKNKFREKAKKAGEIKYFDPRPCSRGHVTDRYVSTYKCVECNKEYLNQRYKTNEEYREKHKQTSKEYHKRIGTKWYHENKEKAAVQNKIWREAHKEEFKEYCTNWRRNNLAKLTKNAAAYRAQKLQATPKWANYDKIQEIYDEAHLLTEQTGITHTVDHYYPLVSEVICGLHVETNLQILTLSKNSSKSNSVPD
ncbi:hypothetical protein LCGC14_2087040 [marine sediment metagenome]|uniref:Uncharacterized protein n=1 Tax=marine sediment metagenome TaxID=412755 RepID=A0A0F9EDR7_9ZZZZ